MAIKMRRGKYGDFDMDRMTAGELAVVLGGDPDVPSGKSIYFTVAPGDCRRLMTREDLTAEIRNAIGEITSEVQQDIDKAMTDIGIEEGQRKAAESARESSEASRAAAEAQREQDSGAAIRALQTVQETVEDKLAAGGFIGEKGDKGDTGGIAYATFDVDDGNLMMDNVPGLTHTGFALENGELILEVIG